MKKIIILIVLSLLLIGCSGICSMSGEAQDKMINCTKLEKSDCLNCIVEYFGKKHDCDVRYILKYYGKLCLK